MIVNGGGVSIRRFYFSFASSFSFSLVSLSPCIAFFQLLTTTHIKADFGARAFVCVCVSDMWLYLCAMYFGRCRNNVYGCACRLIIQLFFYFVSILTWLPQKKWSQHDTAEHLLRLLMTSNIFHWIWKTNVEFSWRPWFHNSQFY